jgi:transposase
MADMEALAISIEKTPAEYEAEIEALRRQIDTLCQANRILEEKVRYLLQQRFGRKAETIPPTQLHLFEAPTSPANEELPLESVTIPAHARAKGGRRRPPADLPRQEVIIDLPEDEKHCGGCGALRQVIGEERSERYEMEPAKVWVEEQIRLIYACPCCDIGPVTAPAPPVPLPRTQASAGLLAYVGVGKFADALPLHRQAQILTRRFGVPFTSTTLAAWMSQTADRLLMPLLEAMEPTLLGCDYRHMDETRLQVLEEPGRTARQLSWVWVRVTGIGIPVIRFDYSPSRSGRTAAGLLEGFSGYLQCDGLGSYEAAAAAVDGIVLVGCWTHARRKFDAAIKAGPKDTPPPLAVTAMALIRRLYRIDAEVKGQPPKVRHAHRQTHSRPLIDEIRRWLDAHLEAALQAGGLLAKACHYLHHQWPKLVRFLEDGRLELDNNSAERPFRPVAVGRKNWLFCRSEEGARATAIWYSVVATAQANGWEPYQYLRRVLTDIPLFLQQPRSLEPLLPWNLRTPSAPP